MFPGDAETQNDCVQVDHKGDVTVHFRAEVRPGYEKLAEVLKLRVSVGGSVLYDGLMAETPPQWIPCCRPAAIRWTIS